MNTVTKDKLRKILGDAYERGDSIPDIINLIKDYYRDCEKGRAEKIARTETSAASSEGSLERYRDAGVAEVEFYVAKDEATCEECLLYLGERFPIDGYHSLIPVHPNCRCVWLPVIESV